MIKSILGFIFVSILSAFSSTTFAACESEQRQLDVCLESSNQCNYTADCRSGDVCYSGRCQRATPSITCECKMERGSTLGWSTINLNMSALDLQTGTILWQRTHKSWDVNPFAGGDPDAYMKICNEMKDSISQCR